MCRFGSESQFATQRHLFGLRPVLFTFRVRSPRAAIRCRQALQPHTSSVAFSFGLTTSPRVTPMPEPLADSKAPSYPLRNLLWRWWVAEEVILLYTADRPQGKGCTQVSDFASLYSEATYEAKN